MSQFAPRTSFAAVLAFVALVTSCAAHPAPATPAAAPAAAGTLQVVCSGGFTAALQTLTPEFERTSGTKLAISAGPSMGNTPNAIPQRLGRGEPIDVVIMARGALDKLSDEGKVAPDSRVDLARSVIGIVVKKGAPHPDISTPDALKRALLAASSIAYSDSASGVYVSTELFQKLGIADQVQTKAHMIPATPVAETVARGDAEIGFQQISELLPVPGIDLVGTLPAELQKVTVFSAGIVAGSHAPDAAAALIKFLAAPAAQGAVTQSGLLSMTTAPN